MGQPVSINGPVLLRLQDAICTYTAGHPGPRAIVKGLAGGLHGKVNVGLVSLSDPGDHLAGAWVPGLERLACI